MEMIHCVPEGSRRVGWERVRACVCERERDGVCLSVSVCVC